MAKSVTRAVSVAPVAPVEVALLLEQLATRPLPPSALRIAMLALAGQLRGSALVVSASKLGAMLGVHRNAVGEARKALVASGVAQVEQSNPFCPSTVVVQVAPDARSAGQHAANGCTVALPHALAQRDSAAREIPQPPIVTSPSVQGAVHEAKPFPAHADASTQSSVFLAPAAGSLDGAVAVGAALPPNLVARTRQVGAPTIITPAPTDRAVGASISVAPARKPKLSPVEMLERMQALSRRMSPMESASYAEAMLACQASAFKRDSGSSALTDEDVAFLIATIPARPSQPKQEWEPVSQVRAPAQPNNTHGPAISPEALEAAKQEVLGAANQFKGLCATARARVMTEALWARAAGQIRTVRAVVALVGQGRWSRPRGMPDSFRCPDFIAASGAVAVGC